MAPGAELFEVPNLDAMEAAELKQLGEVFVKLSIYAEHKERAIGLRLKGDVEAAIAFEKAAERVYAKLPQWAKW